MQVEVGVNMRVLVVVRRDVEHLETGDGVVGYRGHPLCMESLGGQALRVGHFRPQLRPGQGQPLPLQRVQARVQRGEGVRPGHGGQRDGAVPGEVLHGICGRVERVHLRRLHLEAGLHPLPQLPLPDLPLAHLPLPELALPHGRVGVVQAGHVIGQERVCGVERHEERVVPVGGGHDVGPRVLAEGAQGRGVGPDVRRHGRDGGGRPVEGRSHVGGAGQMRLTHSLLVRGTGSFLLGRRGRNMST